MPKPWEMDWQTAAPAAPPPAQKPWEMPWESAAAPTKTTAGTGRTGPRLKGTPTPSPAAAAILPMATAAMIGGPVLGEAGAVLPLGAAAEGISRLSDIAAGAGRGAAEEFPGMWDLLTHPKLAIAKRLPGMTRGAIAGARSAARGEFPPVGSTPGAGVPLSELGWPPGMYDPVRPPLAAGESAQVPTAKPEGILPASRGVGPVRPPVNIGGITTTDPAPSIPAVRIAPTQPGPGPVRPPVLDISGTPFARGTPTQPPPAPAPQPTAGPVSLDVPFEQSPSAAATTPKTPITVHSVGEISKGFRPMGPSALIPPEQGILPLQEGSTVFPTQTGGPVKVGMNHIVDWAKTRNLPLPVAKQVFANHGMIGDFDVATPPPYLP